MYFLLVKHVCFDIKVSLVFDMGDRSSIATPNFGGQSKEKCNSSSQLKERDKVVACWSYLYVKMALHSGAAPKMKVKSKFLYIDMWIISLVDNRVDLAHMLQEIAPCITSSST